MSTMLPRVVFSLLATFTASTLCAQGIEDVLVIGSRKGNDYHKISRGGEVLKVQASKPSTSVRGANRAPDGKIWVVNFIQATLTILKPDLSVFSHLTSLPGYPSSVAFSRMSKTGTYATYVVLNNTNQVLVFDQNAQMLNMLSIMPTPPFGDRALGCNMDVLGNLWVGIRGRSAGSLYKLNTQTMQFSGPYKFPALAANLGGQVYGSTGLRVYTMGDGSRDVFEFDLNGKFLRQASLSTVGTGGVGEAAIDLNGMMWVPDWRNGSLYQFNTVSMTTVRIHQDSRLRSTIGCAIDGEGGIWVIDRSTTPSLAYKYNQNGRIEQYAPVGTNTSNSGDFTGYSYANVVDPNGDNDGDGETNRSELKNGTNPFNAQSNSALSLRMDGTQYISQTVRFTLARRNLSTLPALIAFGLRANPPISAPIFTGKLMINPALLLVATVGSTSATKPLNFYLPLPNNPALRGIPLMFQGMALDKTFVMSDGEGFVIR